MMGSAWTWPVELSRYERETDLAPAQKEALARAVCNIAPTNSSYVHAAPSELERLFGPVYGVLELMGSDGTSRLHAIRRLLWQMHHRGTPYWAWSQEEWLKVLRDEGPATAQNAPRWTHGRQNLVATAYLLCGFEKLEAVRGLGVRPLAERVFGKGLVDAVRERIYGRLVGWGHSPKIFSLSGTTGEHSTLERMLLANRSPHLEDLTIEKLEKMHRLRMPNSNKPFLVAISRVLAAEDLITKPLTQAKKSAYPHEGRKLSGCPEEWVRWSKKWFDTATITETTRRHYYGNLLRAGRWMAYAHPGVESPEQWTREMAAEYVAAVTRLRIGDWLRGDEPWPRTRDLGRPASAATKQHMIAAVRTWFRDLQEWGMVPRRFDPRVALATPRSVLAQIKRDPRVIADDVWAKLLWAGLNLREEDLPRRGGANAKPWYPLEMVRAAAVVWLFAGLRGDEIRRLPVGCVRWRRESVASSDGNGTSGKEAICWLDVPVNKTGDAFTKPVDGIVGKAVEAWEAMRPEQPAVIDRKTAEAVHYLFSYGGRRFGVEYLNHRLVPLLCRKAGVPEEDARGRITSHRARSTITTHLYNADEPMSLFELQEWLGHRSPEATQYYAKITPTRLAKSYSDAGYFRRNARTIEVLLDGEAIRNGEAANGKPWKFYDLGHGYCSYDFYSQCPHRMACARCSFYVPKNSTKSQILEGKANLSRMREELPLSDEEIAAVEEGIGLHERLLERLADTPTPAGPTPRELLKLKPRPRREANP